MLIFEMANRTTLFTQRNIFTNKDMDLPDLIMKDAFIYSQGIPSKFF